MHVLFIGDTTVGKTSLIHNICGKEFKEKLQMTIGFEISTVNHQDYRFDDKELTLVDTGEYYLSKAIISTLMPFITCIIIVFDVYSYESYRYALTLYSEYKDKNYVMIIVGNKGEEMDRLPLYVEESTRDITLLVSAKTGKGVKDAFMKLFDLLAEFRGITSRKKKDSGCCFS